MVRGRRIRSRAQVGVLRHPLRPPRVSNHPAVAARKPPAPVPPPSPWAASLLEGRLTHTWRGPGTQFWGGRRAGKRRPPAAARGGCRRPLRRPRGGAVARSISPWLHRAGPRDDGQLRPAADGGAPPGSRPAPCSAPAKQRRAELGWWGFIWPRDSATTTTPGMLEVSHLLEKRLVSDAANDDTAVLLAAGEVGVGAVAACASTRSRGMCELPASRPEFFSCLVPGLITMIISHSSFWRARLAEGAGSETSLRGGSTGHSPCLWLHSIITPISSGCRATR